MKDKRLLVSIIVGLILACGISTLRGLLSASSAKEVFMALSDGFFVAGVLFLGVGILSFVKNQGAFDALTFSVRNVFRLRWPAMGSFKEEYSEYRDKKSAERKPSNDLLISGAVYTALGLVFLAVYFLV